MIGISYPISKLFAVTYLLSDTEVAGFFIECCFREINEDLAGDSVQDSCGQQEE